MGGEQSAFRSLAPSASTAAVALLQGLRQHQRHQQQQMEDEQRRRKSWSVSEGEHSDNESVRSEDKNELRKDRNGNICVGSKRGESVDRERDEEEAVDSLKKKMRH